MKGYDLIERLNKDFAVRGTAGTHVLVRDQSTGVLFRVVGVSSEPDDVDGSTIHCVDVEPFQPCRLSTCTTA